MADPHDYYVYALFRETGVPFYVGKGRRERWLIHEWQASRGYRGHRQSIIRSMQARGLEVPKIKLHEGLTEAEANTYEITLIAAIGRRCHGGPLVNRTDGGDGISGARHSAEARAKMSIRTRERNLTESPETRAKRAAWHRGRKRPPETGALIAAKVANRPQVTDETRAKMSKAGKGRPKPPQHGAKLSAFSSNRARGPDGCWLPLSSPPTRA